MQIATINKVINNVPSISINFVAQNRISFGKTHLNFVFTFRFLFVGANMGLLVGLSILFIKAKEKGNKIANQFNQL